MRACADGTLADTEVKFRDGAACCVIMASDGYPQKYASGFEIKFEDGIEKNVYVAGAKLDGGKLLSAGGRVLGVTATADTLDKAIERAYAGVTKVSFENAYFRRDIGKKALAAFSEK
jgi:phosphoribosylamine--glycine ligase